jgi:small-conductance mechanosensitive channel
LNFFLIWEPISDFLLSIWELGYEFGKVKLTVGNIIHVFLTILAFYIVASIISIILRKEVFHRVDLPRGVGNAVASVTQYTVVVVGVFLALASAGFETQHLSILVGGLGIGIGFGLQSIFNNFLSGLILVFERPVTVDDVVEVDGMLGVVTSIGIRASKIRQYNGDEVIVPNSDLIAKRVINRTLSDKRRRYTMEFETGRKVQPDKVVEIIAAAAAGVEGVLDDPPAKAYFKGMEQQSNFYYVHYWGEDNFLDLMSDVEVAVYKAFGKEGVDMPIPIAVELDEVPKEIID